MSVEINIVFEETYTSLREAKIEMNEEEYKNYINGHVPLDSIIKHSNSIKDFKDKTKLHKNAGYKIKKITTERTIKSNLVLEKFELDHIEDKNNG